jgi:predicted RNase H-like HicB family nuclease
MDQSPARRGGKSGLGRIQGRWLLVKIKVVVHEAEEGGYWAEVPAIPGCATQGETFEGLLKNLHEAVEGCLSVDVGAAKKTPIFCS